MADLLSLPTGSRTDIFQKIQILANNKISFTGSYQVKLVRINYRYFST